MGECCSAYPLGKTDEPYEVFICANSLHKDLSIVHLYMESISLNAPLDRFGSLTFVNQSFPSFYADDSDDHISLESEDQHNKTLFADSVNDKNEGLWENSDSEMA